MKILVVGGTGLVGRELLKLLSERKGIEIVSLVRRLPEPKRTIERVGYREFNFDHLEAFSELSKESFDVVFCCLGTTRKKAGSAREFIKVDFEYPQRLIASLKSCSPLFGLVSSVGADRPVGLYLKTKFDLEKSIVDSGFRYIIVRPSLLLGERDEFRFGERLVAFLFSPMRNLMRKKLGFRMACYAPIDAKEVAAALVFSAFDSPTLPRKGGVILQGYDLFNAASKI